ncbi:MAG: hypothetical protein V3W41_22540 [Planctomycetota bacterium]
MTHPNYLKKRAEAQAPLRFCSWDNLAKHLPRRYQNGISTPAARLIATIGFAAGLIAGAALTKGGM